MSDSEWQEVTRDTKRVETSGATQQQPTSNGAASHKTANNSNNNNNNNSSNNNNTSTTAKSTGAAKRAAPDAKKCYNCGKREFVCLCVCVCEWCVAGRAASGVTLVEARTRRCCVYVSVAIDNAA
jgi:hypothetical protein